MKLNKCLDVLVEALSSIDYRGFWSIEPPAIASCFNGILFNDFYRDVNQLKKSNENEIIKIFPNNTTLWKFIIRLLSDMKRSKISIDEKIKFINYLLNLFDSSKEEGIFCSEDKNIVFSKKDLNENLEFLTDNFNENDIKNISKLSNLLFSLCECLYFANRTISDELHGPYIYKNKKLLIRDFSNLKPIELCPEIKKFPYEKIRILKLYKNLDIKIDVLNNYYIKGNYIPEKFGIIIDNKKIKFDEISHINKILEYWVLKMTKKVEKMNRNERAKLLISTYYYSVKSLRDKLKIGWNPPKKIYERVDSGFVKSQPKIKLDKNKLRVMLDPRIK